MLDAVALHMGSLSIMNVWIPFQISSEGVQNHDETRSVVFGFIHFKEQRRNNAGDSMEETV